MDGWIINNNNNNRAKSDKSMVNNVYIEYPTSFYLPLRLLVWQPLDN